MTGLSLWSFGNYKEGLLWQSILSFAISFVFVTYVEVENKLKLPYSSHKSE